MNMELDKSLIIPDGSKTFAEGVIAALSTNQELPYEAAGSCFKLLRLFA